MKRIILFFSLVIITTISVQAQNSYYDEYGIEYSYSEPTIEQITAWKEKFGDRCRELVKDKLKSFTEFQPYVKITRTYEIPRDMLQEEPCLAYLIIISKSVEGYKEKQSWFDLYSLMDKEKIMKLYIILYKEQYKLLEIDRKYSN